MNKINFRTNDLNLLPIFNALCLERNVSRAAERLGLTQSAVSHALKRLRDELGDDLFIRSSKGIVPTPFALSLRDKITPLLESIEGFYQKETAFQPQTADAKITIATTDYLEAVILPHVLSTLRQQAPGVTVVSKQARTFPRLEIENGEIDIAIAGYFGELPEGFYQRHFLSDGFYSAVRRDHPILGGKAVSIEEFTRYEHILISPQGDMRGRVDSELAKIKLNRRVVAGTSSFLSPAWVISESDVILTAPARLIAAFEKYFPLKTFPTPVNAGTIQMIQVWHGRTHRSALHRWMRDLLSQVANKLN